MTPKYSGCMPPVALHGGYVPIMWPYRHVFHASSCSESMCVCVCGCVYIYAPAPAHTHSGIVIGQAGCASMRACARFSRMCEARGILYSSRSKCARVGEKDSSHGHRLWDCLIDASRRVYELDPCSSLRRRGFISQVSS